MSRTQKTEYALYHGDEFIVMGTIKEIAKYRNIKESSKNLKDRTLDIEPQSNIKMKKSKRLMVTFVGIMGKEVENE